MEEISEIVDEAMQESIADESQQLSDDFDELEKSPFQGKYHKQSYRKAWESLPDFKGWLEGVVGEPNRAFCSYCQVTLFAHRLSLLKHTCTIKHQKASQKALYAKSNGIISDGTKVSIIPSTSQPTMQHMSDSIKLNLRSVKVQQSLTSNMTVTIIQDESDDQLGLQLAQNISDTDNSALITDDDDLGLNTVQSVELEVEEVTESQVSPTESLSMAHSSAFPLSTHVLDTSKGQPVTQLPVSLYRLIDSRWTLINESVTNQDGRCSGLIRKEEFVAGRYKLHFDTDRYFELERKETLYPFVEIAFDVHAPLDHYHIPLLLSAFGYSTYRGS